jgi:hypothetical protein
MSRENNRAAMPTVAQIVDQFREFMGSVVFASENGSVIDRREPVSDDQVFTIPDGYLKPAQERVKR